MKYAVFSGVLFLISYVLANGGIGDPMKLIMPTVVAIAVAAGVAWVGQRRRGRKPKSDVEALLQGPLGVAPPRPRTPSRPGGGARKLF